MAENRDDSTIYETPRPKAQLLQETGESHDYVAAEEMHFDLSNKDKPIVKHGETTIFPPDGKTHDQVTKEDIENLRNLLKEDFGGQIRDQAAGAQGLLPLLTKMEQKIDRQQSKPQTPLNTTEAPPVATPPVPESGPTYDLATAYNPYDNNIQEKQTSTRQRPTRQERAIYDMAFQNDAITQTTPKEKQQTPERDLYQTSNKLRAKSQNKNTDFYSTIAQESAYTIPPNDKEPNIPPAPPPTSTIPSLKRNEQITPQSIFSNRMEKTKQDLAQRVYNKTNGIKNDKNRAEAIAARPETQMLKLIASLEHENPSQDAALIERVETLAENLTKKGSSKSVKETNKNELSQIQKDINKQFKQPEKQNKSQKTPDDEYIELNNESNEQIYAEIPKKPQPIYDNVAGTNEQGEPILKEEPTSKRPDAYFNRPSRKEMQQMAQELNQQEPSPLTRNGAKKEKQHDVKLAQQQQLEKETLDTLNTLDQQLEQQQQEDPTYAIPADAVQNIPPSPKRIEGTHQQSTDVDEELYATPQTTAANTTNKPKFTLSNSPQTETTIDSPEHSRPTVTLSDIPAGESKTDFAEQMKATKDALIKRIEQKTKGLKGDKLTRTVNNRPETEVLRVIEKLSKLEHRQSSFTEEQQTELELLKNGAITLANAYTSKQSKSQKEESKNNLSTLTGGVTSLVEAIKAPDINIQNHTQDTAAPSKPTITLSDTTTTPSETSTDPSLQELQAQRDVLTSTLKTQMHEQVLPLRGEAREQALKQLQPKLDELEAIKQEIDRMEEQAGYISVEEAQQMVNSPSPEGKNSENTPSSTPQTPEDERQKEFNRLNKQIQQLKNQGVNVTDFGETRTKLQQNFEKLEENKANLSQEDYSNQLNSLQQSFTQLERAVASQLEPEYLEIEPSNTPEQNQPETNSQTLTLEDIDNQQETSTDEPSLPSTPSTHTPSNSPTPNQIESDTISLAEGNDECQLSNTTDPIAEKLTREAQPIQKIYNFEKSGNDAAPLIRYTVPPKEKQVANIEINEPAGTRHIAFLSKKHPISATLPPKPEKGKDPFGKVQTTPNEQGTGVNVTIGKSTLHVENLGNGEFTLDTTDVKHMDKFGEKPGFPLHFNTQEGRIQLRIGQNGAIEFDNNLTTANDLSAVSFTVKGPEGEHIEANLVRDPNEPSKAHLIDDEGNILVMGKNGYTQATTKNGQNITFDPEQGLITTETSVLQKDNGTFKSQFYTDPDGNQHPVTAHQLPDGKAVYSIENLDGSELNIVVQNGKEGKSSQMELVTFNGKNVLLAEKNDVNTIMVEDRDQGYQLLTRDENGKLQPMKCEGQLVFMDHNGTITTKDFSQPEQPPHTVKLNERGNPTLLEEATGLGRNLAGNGVSYQDKEETPSPPALNEEIAVSRSNSTRGI